MTGKGSGLSPKASSAPAQGDNGGVGGQIGDRSAIVAPTVNPGMAGQTAMAGAALSAPIQDLLSQVGSGKISLQDALSAAGNMQGADPYASKRAAIQQEMMNVGNSGGDQAVRDSKLATLQSQLDSLPTPDQASGAMRQQAINALFTDPRTASLMAQYQTQNDPIMKGLFGQGGIQDQAQGQFGALNQNLDQDRNALMGRDESYGLTNNDLKAYGQASGNIARLFGNQEQNLAQTLADRGLSAGASGVAGAGYSGLMGNKMEQLAGLQQQIAQNRIQTAQGLAQARTTADLNRQGQNNQLMQNLGVLGQNAEGNQFNRNMAGAEFGNNTQNTSAQNSMTNQAQQQNVANSQFGQIQDTAPPSLGSILGTLGGAALGAATGGFGAGLGKAAGTAAGKIFGG